MKPTETPVADRVHVTRSRAKPGGKLVDGGRPFRERKPPWLKVPAPGGPTYFMVDGDARLATAGTGDVLAGTIGALLAMGAPALEAAAAGAWIHARAGDTMDPRGLVAGDVIAAIPLVLNSLSAS